MCILVTCKNCNGSVAKGKLSYTYSLSAENIGKSKQCSKCGAYSYKGDRKFSWWFCCRKCLVEFLSKTTEKDYKYDWEETVYQMQGIYEKEKKVKK